MPTTPPSRHVPGPLGEDLMGARSSNDGASRWLAGIGQDMVPVGNDPSKWNFGNGPRDPNTLVSRDLITQDANGNWVTPRYNIRGNFANESQFGGRWHNQGYLTLAALAAGGIAAGGGFGAGAGTGYVDTLGDAITGGSAGAPTTGALSGAAGAPVGGGGGPIDVPGPIDPIPEPGPYTPVVGEEGFSATGSGSMGAGTNATGASTVIPEGGGALADTPWWESILNKAPDLITKLPGILSAIGGKPAAGGGGNPLSGVGGKAVDGLNIPAKKVELEQNQYMKPPKASAIKSLGDYLRG